MDWIAAGLAVLQAVVFVAVILTFIIAAIVADYREMQ